MAICNHPNPAPSAMFLSCLKFLRGCPWFVRLKTPPTPYCAGPTCLLEPLPASLASWWCGDSSNLMTLTSAVTCTGTTLSTMYTLVFPGGFLLSLPILAQASLAHLAPAHSWFPGTPRTNCQCLSWGPLCLSLTHWTVSHGSQAHLSHAPQLAAHSSMQSVCPEGTETLGVVQWWCEVHRSLRSKQEVSSFSSSSCW